MAIKVFCDVVRTPRATSCEGTLGLFELSTKRRIARSALTIPAGTSAEFTLTISRRAFRRLTEDGGLPVKVRARANGRVSRKNVNLTT